MCDESQINLNTTFSKSLDDWKDRSNPSPGLRVYF